MLFEADEDDEDDDVEAAAAVPFGGTGASAVRGIAVRGASVSRRRLSSSN